VSTRTNGGTEVEEDSRCRLKKTQDVGLTQQWWRERIRVEVKLSIHMV
jgi:hypothetical protein